MTTNTSPESTHQKKKNNVWLIILIVGGGVIAMVSFTFVFIWVVSGLLNSSLFASL